MEFECDGVHLGPDDAGFDRRGAGAQSAGGPFDRPLVRHRRRSPLREREDADYLGIGAVYATASKEDAGAPIGIDGLRAIAAESWCPAVAIGGIGLTQIDAVRATGVSHGGGDFCGRTRIGSGRCRRERWWSGGMPATRDFAGTFAVLKGLFVPYAARLHAAQDTATFYMLDGEYVSDFKRAMPFGGVQIRRAFVSFHLSPIYTIPNCWAA